MSGTQIALMSSPIRLGMPKWYHPLAHSPPDIRAITQRAINVYLASKQPNGQMGGIGWWQSANGYTAIALYDSWSDNKRNYDVLANSLRHCEVTHPGLINEFNDDSLWWAICCLHVFNLGADLWFLDIAKAIWQHVRNSGSVCRKGQLRFRGQDMEGACFWTSKPDEEQIKSISTGLFAELSVRLGLIRESETPEKHRLGRLFGLRAQDPSTEDYLEAARCSLEWILRCRYRPSEAVVLDGILLKARTTNDWTFTYTTGVTMGVCALLYEASGEQEYLTLAIRMAHHAMRRKDWVEADGVLTEPGAYGKGTHSPAENNDAVGFKSVLIRHLATLYQVIVQKEIPGIEAEDVAALIRAFVNINFLSLQERNSNGNGQYGPWWSGPFEMPTSHSQMAVLDVMAAVTLVNRP